MLVSPFYPPKLRTIVKDDGAVGGYGGEMRAGQQKGKTGPRTFRRRTWK